MKIGVISWAYSGGLHLLQLRPLSVVNEGGQWWLASGTAQAAPCVISENTLAGSPVILSGHSGAAIKWTRTGHAGQSDIPNGKMRA